MISHAQRNQHRDVHRFEKISNIIKQFKLSCSKLAANFQSLEVRNSNFSSFIDMFTANTYIMVILSDSKIPAEAILINIRWHYFDSIDIRLEHKLFFIDLSYIKWYVTSFTKWSMLFLSRNARKYFEKLEKENQLQQGRQPAFGR